MMEQCRSKQKEERVSVELKFSFVSITYTKLTAINLIRLCTSV